MGRYRTVSMSTTVEAAIADGYSALEELKDEISSVVEEAQGSNRENTQRIQTLSDTLDILENASVDSPPNLDDLPESLRETSISYSEHKVIRGRYGKSREVRSQDACSMLTAAYEGLRAYADKFESVAAQNPDETAEIRQIADSIEEVVNNVETCEWPGMYG